MKTILVIEDEKPLLEAIDAKLQSSGFNVLRARSVKQGLDYLENVKNIDAIWLDHYLGTETGLDLMAKLRESDKWADIPVFLVSNTASPDKVEQYIKLGADKYYVKAENRLDEIIAGIRSFMHIK